MLTLIRDFFSCSLLLDDKGNTFILWRFTEKQQKFYRRKIPWFLCFKMADLCEKHMRTPHASCPTCKLLKAVRGDLPLLTAIIIRQVWDIQPKGKVKEILFRHLLSLAEMFS